MNRTPSDFDTVITCGTQPGHCAPDTLLGHNLEAMSSVIGSMLSDRLDNPKFTGPADPQTGLAPGWLPTGRNMGDTRCRLVAGMSLSGNESQLVQRYGFLDEGFLQPGRSVRKDETLEIELWAKARHRPVPLQFSIGPLPCRQPPYDSTALTVDAAYWKRYTATLSVPCDDDQAVLTCLLLDEATVLIDQIHLRPVDEPHLCRAMIDRIASLRIPLLRFPGGCLSTNYHWRHGTGPIHLRPALPDPVFKFHAQYDFGTDEYLDLCHQQGIRPHITVNVGSGTPDEAAEWAAYCASWYRQRGVEPPPAYFQIGNEHYGVHESAHMTGGMYVDTLKAFVPPIRDAYPNCRIVALGQVRSAGLRTELRTPWLEPVLAEAADYFDVLTLNRYKGQWNDSAIDRQINTIESVTKIQDDLEELLTAIRAHGLTKTVALTEWNYWLHASHHDSREFYEPGDAQHACFAAGMLNMFARLAPEMELATYYHLVQAMALLRRNGADVQENCVAEVFRLYRPAFPGNVLPLYIQSPKLGETETAVDALGMRTGEATWLFIANRDPEQSTSVELHGLKGRPDDVVMLQAESPTDDIRIVDAPPADSTITLPPLSMCRLRYGGVET